MFSQACSASVSPEHYYALGWMFGSSLHYLYMMISASMKYIIIVKVYTYDGYVTLWCESFFKG